MSSKFVNGLAIVAVVFGACVSQEHPSDSGTCSCASELAQLEVSNCAPQEDGSCIDAGVHEGTLADVFEYVCNYTDSDGVVEPDISCAGNVVAVACRGVTLHFRIVAADGECRVESQER
jgi:hypothetical protein